MKRSLLGPGLNLRSSTYTNTAPEGNPVLNQISRLRRSWVVPSRVGVPGTFHDDVEIASGAFPPAARPVLALFQEVEVDVPWGKIMVSLDDDGPVAASQDRPAPGGLEAAAGRLLPTYDPPECRTDNGVDRWFGSAQADEARMARGRASGNGERPYKLPCSFALESSTARTSGSSLREETSSLR